MAHASQRSQGRDVHSSGITNAAAGVLHLHRRRHFPDLVEEQRGPSGGFDVPFSLRMSAHERACSPPAYGMVAAFERPLFLTLSSAAVGTVVYVDGPWFGPLRNSR